MITTIPFHQRKEKYTVKHTLRHNFHILIKCIKINPNKSVSQAKHESKIIQNGLQQRLNSYMFWKTLFCLHDLPSYFEHLQNTVAETCL